MSQWINFVKNFARENNMTYGDALKEAKPFYDEYMKGEGYQHKRYKGRGFVDYDQMAEDLLGYGGAEAQKGALAALLSGLDARIQIK